MTAVKNKIIEVLIRVTKEKVVHLETPEIGLHGDYSTNIAMALFSKTKSKKPQGNKKIISFSSDFKSPKGLAEKIVEKISKDSTLSKYVSKIEVAGPGFINFWLTRSHLVSNLERVVEKKGKYGSSDLLKGKNILLEHTSPNTIKTLHVGHVRNNILGMTIHNIFKFCGADVKMDVINNDRGIHVMKAVWAYNKFGKEETPRIKKEKPDHFVDTFYVKGVKAFEEDRKVKEGIRELLRKWESGDEKVRKIWDNLRTWTLEGFQQTYKRLGSHHDYQWFESEFYRYGKEMIEEGLKKGIFRKLGDGAVLSNLEKYGLSDAIVLRADGTSMYHTQDLYLTKLKRERFPSDLYIWDVGPEQELYLKQLFAMCEQLGIGERKDYCHMFYGFVYLKGGGKMSSRAGNVISADDLMDDAVLKAKEIIEKSETTRGLSEIEKKEVSEMVGMGAIKYGFLKVGRTTDLYFDIDESLSMQGNSGPYLQYTYARTKSVFRKGQRTKDKGQKINFEDIEFNMEELDLLRTFIKFQETIESAAENYAPNLICNYLYDLAQKFNVFYNKHRILDIKGGRVEERGSVRKFRLTLTVATGQILKNGLTLLGIQAPAKM